MTDSAASKITAASKLAAVVGLSLIGTTADQISASIKTMRNVTIQITNNSKKYTLANPRTHTTSGYCYHTPQPTIPPNYHEVCSFSKTANVACGAVGVLTYQILTEKEEYIGELSIMFSVPFNYNHYTNWFALGIFKHNVPCDDALFYQMYYEGGPFQRQKGTGCCMSYSDKQSVVKGTMSPQGKAVMKLEFSDV
ncbi:DELTA-actitoxin-Afr1c-like isoform X2 [Hoplias malabaricus]